jgi:hypothetical protein
MPVILPLDEHYFENGIDQKFIPNKVYVRSHQLNRALHVHIHVMLCYDQPMNCNNVLSMHEN